MPTAPLHLDNALDGLASNPALPQDLVRRLLAYRRGFGEVAKRPDLSESMIADIIATGHGWQVHSLALNRHLPDRFRLQLAGHPDSGIRAALVVGGQDACREVFERLIEDPDPTVREYLAQKDHVPLDLRARLAYDLDPSIRATLARWWPHAPVDVRRILLTDPVGTVRAAACSTYYVRRPHPVPPGDLVPALLADPLTRAGAVAHAILDRPTAQRLVADPDYAVRREVAKHPQLPADLRDVLADDPSGAVRLHIFARSDTPEHIRAELYQQFNGGTPPDVRHTDPGGMDDLDDMDDNAIIQEFEDHHAQFELPTMSVPWVTADPLPHVASPYVCFRVSAARAESLAPQAVAQLLRDSECVVRRTMARHAPHLVDPDTAEYIDRHFRPEIKMGDRPADHLPLPPETLRRLATDPDARMRQLAPRDPDLPAPLAAMLAADPDASVRHAIAAHPNLPQRALVVLLADESKWVTEKAAASPSLPREQMEWLLELAGL